MSTDIALVTTDYQVGHRKWMRDLLGETPNITLDISLFTQGNANEAQTVTVTGSPTGGTFTLTYSGQTTSAIAYNASASTVQTALAALSNIGAGNVAVTGSNGGPYTVTFQGTLGSKNVAQMTASGASLTGGTSPGVTVATSTAGVTGHYPNGYIPSGCAVGKVTATGLFGPYDNGASDGREVCYGLTLSDVTAVRQNGSIAETVGTGAFVRGAVNTGWLPFQSGPGSIDAAAKADLPTIRFEA
ncbi:hypothetical protein [Nocardia wallacei]|uniref:hypothetical protein n=1 Tax=Nocardia wallacei TaxID=480035 RepID=UPI002453DAC3|nr:hypothetical protein [Nocardia wallacei]